MWVYITPQCIRVKNLLARCLRQRTAGSLGKTDSPDGSHNSSGSNRDIRPRVRITITRVFTMFGSDRPFPSL
jgi:hypothetical protein